MPRKLPKFLDADEKRQFTSVFNTRYDSGVKNLCMVRQMLEVGLRVSELCTLRVRDPNMSSMSETGRAARTEYCGSGRPGRPGGRQPRRRRSLPRTATELLDATIER